MLLPDIWEQTGGLSVRIYVGISTLGVLTHALLGWVLLRKSQLIARYAFGATDRLVRSQGKSFFIVGIKLLGAFIAMIELLTFVKLFSSSSIMSSLSGKHETIFEWIGVATNYLPSLILVLAGCWLFFRGELLANWAFPERSSPGAHLDS